MDLLILGASARAAAWSARRAGLRPFAVDLFADRDLAAVADCRRVALEDYPGALADAAEALPAAPWLYTGGLENHPDLVDRVARARPLWGNGPAVLRAARDPLALAEALRRAGLDGPEVRAGGVVGQTLPRDGSWLRKPLASAGGVGVRRLLPGVDGGGPAYFQRRVEGVGLSAVYVASAAGVWLAGLTRPLTGVAGSEYAYRGSVGPWPVGAEVAGAVEAVGRVVAERFALIGLFGVDLVVDRDGRPRVVEVNPRYTGSVEVLELAYHRDLLTDHRLACEGGRVRSMVSLCRHFVAKEVLYARSDVLVRDLPFPWPPALDDLFRVPRAADVPHSGERIAAGEPVLTLFGTGPTPTEARRRLAGRRRVWSARIGLGGPPAGWPSRADRG